MDTGRPFPYEQNVENKAMEVINKQRLKELLTNADTLKIDKRNEGISFKANVIESFLSVIELSVDKELEMTRGGYYPSMQFYEGDKKVLSISFNLGSDCIQIYNFKSPSGPESLLGVVQNKKELNDWFQTHNINWR